MDGYDLQSGFGMSSLSSLVYVDIFSVENIHLVLWVNMEASMPFQGSDLSVVLSKRLYKAKESFLFRLMLLAWVSDFNQVVKVFPIRLSLCLLLSSLCLL